MMVSVQPAVYVTTISTRYSASSTRLVQVPTKGVTPSVVVVRPVVPGSLNTVNCTLVMVAVPGAATVIVSPASKTHGDAVVRPVPAPVDPAAVTVAPAQI